MRAERDVVIQAAEEAQYWFDEAERYHDDRLQDLRTARDDAMEFADDLQDRLIETEADLDRTKKVLKDCQLLFFF